MLELDAEAYDEDKYYDDKTGEALETRLVEKAEEEEEELDYMMKLGVGEEVDGDLECWEKTGKGSSVEEVREG